MTNNIFIQEDRLGNLLNNKILNEIHNLDINNNLLIPNFLTYFTNSIIVKAIDDNNIETLLVRGTDYLCTDFNSKLSVKTGEELCSTIILLDKKNCNKFSITYQAFGGFLNPNYKELINSIKNLTSNVLVNWKDILNKPDGFPPKSNHRHIWKDVFGMEYLVDTIARLIDSIENKPTFTELNLPNKISEYFNSVPTIEIPILNNTHANSTDNFHKLNKQQINLNNVENYITLNTYSRLDEVITSNLATLNKEFKNRKQHRYITNNVAYGYIAEVLEIQINELNNRINSFNTIKNNLENTVTTLENSYNSKQTELTNINNNFSNALLNSNTISNQFKNYRLFNWNYEIAKISKAMLEKEYLISNSYSSIYNIFNYLDLPYLWLDFSDLSTMNLDGSNNIISITDKSSYSRLFQQNNSLNRPNLVTNTNIGVGKINRNNSARFLQNNFLSQVINNNLINLNKNFSLIILTKTTTTTNCLLSNSNNSNYLFTNKNTKSISLETNKYTIDTVNNSSSNNDSNIVFLNVCDDSVGVTYSNSNLLNNSTFLSNINSINKTNDINLMFDTLGDKNTATNHDFTLCEFMIFNRLISKEEIITINSYLSRKWSGSTDFTIDLTNLNSL